MNWQALWNDGFVISAHALLAMLAIVLGAMQLAGAKGTLRHRRVGFAWVGIMALVAVSSFWIHKLQWLGPFSAIHGLSLLVLGTLAYSVNAARRGNLEAHRKSMTQLYVLALLLTGAFTLVPGRTMHMVFFGG